MESECCDSWLKYLAVRPKLPPAIKKQRLPRSDERYSSTLWVESRIGAGLCNEGKKKDKSSQSEKMGGCTRDHWPNGQLSRAQSRTSTHGETHEPGQAGSTGWLDWRYKGEIDRRERVSLLWV